MSRTVFTQEDRAFVESRAMFFLATADGDGRPDCSYKGGHPGFVRVTAASELAFPSYDGNGMFRSLGNIRANAAVALLFLDFDEPRRVRVNGTATLSEDDPLAREFSGAQLIVRVRAEHIFPNCPRYVHRMKVVELSPYAPCHGYAAPIPAWKKMPQFNDVLAPGDPARGT
jgi:predicted pyridoxine 5'-phosphate oxidase superfamily flavin-nucleotide-binding protein